MRANSRQSEPLWDVCGTHAHAQERVCGRAFGRVRGRARARLCGRARTWLVAVLACAVLACVPVGAACAANKIVSDVQLTAPANMQLARIDVREIECATDPAFVEVGVPCGMTEMCGQDPCLCGATDSYGACACNGRRDQPTSVCATSRDEAIVRTFCAFGRTYMVAMGAGEARVDVTAQAPHYENAHAQVSVQVADWTPLDVAKLVAGVAVTAAVVAALVWALRCVARVAVRGCWALAVRGGHALAVRRRERRADVNQGSDQGKD